MRPRQSARSQSRERLASRPSALPSIAGIPLHRHGRPQRARSGPSHRPGAVKEPPCDEAFCNITEAISHDGVSKTVPAVISAGSIPAVVGP